MMHAYSKPQNFGRRKFWRIWQINLSNFIEKVQYMLSAKPFSQIKFPKISITKILYCTVLAY